MATFLPIEPCIGPIDGTLTDTITLALSGPGIYGNGGYFTLFTISKPESHQQIQLMPYTFFEVYIQCILSPNLFL